MDADEARWAAAMAAAQAGDAATYAKLLEELLPVVRRQVRSKLFDPTAVEDVVQNAMLNIHRARRSYRPERPFGPWLRAVVRNAAIDAMRERGRRGAREVSVEAIGGLGEVGADSAPGAQSQLERRELSPEVVDALSALPHKQREAVELIHLEGLSVAAAAARAGVSAGALKVRAHRGYRTLRARLGAEKS